MEEFPKHHTHTFHANISLSFIIRLVVYRHHLEFLIADQVVPYNMTVFQAVRQFAVVRASRKRDVCVCVCVLCCLL